MDNVGSSSSRSKSLPSAKGICAAQGISACGIAGGFRRKPGKLDLAMVVADRLSVAAGVFTKNIFCAAPVTVSREHVKSGYARAIILNSANANAATGEPGLQVARETTEIVAEALGCESEDVLVASTGVIGQPLDIERFVVAVPKAVAALSATGGSDAAHAIMTTDTVPKEYAESFEYGGITYWVGGMAKGSGMIMPDMATMLAVLTTDAPLSVEAARSALKAAVDTSFNKVTVDSDTSTNDSCYLLATGAAGGDKIEDGSDAYEVFLGVLTSVCESLAKKIARDGEGATKLVEVTVVGAASATDADLCARSI
ncbi:MAG: bifunctional glutamate N-acetyltransferase/amino-acid acetyltransferase ArgJ, partial [Actinobacteria bacterium]|nr:bifunctional glutamate N-acetyltransferase/amino-acid acetyltransferase ArgJ [Actinomycetota bacterium]